MSKISSKHKDKPLKVSVLIRFKNNYVIFIIIMLQVFGDHHKFLSRIKKTLYYGKLPKTDRFSLPVTGKVFFAKVDLFIFYYNIMLQCFL